MSVVKINVLTVAAELRETLEQRFAGRAGAVEVADGFEWFELLRPVDGTDRYLVYTRWRSEADFEAWQSSQAFGTAHPQSGGGAPGSADGGAGRPRPAASASEIWSFDVVQSAGSRSAGQDAAAPRDSST